MSPELVRLVLLLLCQVADASTPTPEGVPARQSAEAFRPEPGWRPLGTDLWFDPAGKRVILRSRVCLREGYLEHLLCAKNTKEHESILVTEAPPRLIHAGLLLTGAEVGHPVQFVPEFRVPTGTPIAIEATWTDADGHPHRIDAREWVKYDDSPKNLEAHWVFAGSSLYPHPDTGKMIYAADSGDLITVSNFMSAILDVPFASSADDTARSFLAYTERIPPIGTPVTLILRPVEPAAGQGEPKSDPAATTPSP